MLALRSANSMQIVVQRGYRSKKDMLWIKQIYCSRAEIYTVDDCRAFVKLIVIHVMMRRGLTPTSRTRYTPIWISGNTCSSGRFSVEKQSRPTPFIRWYTVYRSVKNWTEVIFEITTSNETLLGDRYK